MSTLRAMSLIAIFFPKADALHVLGSTTQARKQQDLVLLALAYACIAKRDAITLTLTSTLQMCGFLLPEIIL